jgi:hypothetical protein
LTTSVMKSLFFDLQICPAWWSDSNICIPVWYALLQMLESKDHQQI